MGKKLNNRRIMSPEGNWVYRCNRCELWYVKEGFHIDKTKIFEISYTCKTCRKNNVKPKLLDWENESGEKVLTNLGYDTEKDVHQQFIEKMKLKYGVFLD